MAKKTKAPSIKPSTGKMWFIKSPGFIRGNEGVAKLKMMGIW